MIRTARIRKDPEIRRTELVDAALELFSLNGYENTTIMDIVKKAGVAKGTFFYYFPTKEAVLETIINRWAFELCASFKLKSSQFSALNKLHFFIELLFLPNKIDILCDRLLAEIQFTFLYKLWQQQVETVFNPLLADMIRQGNQEGTMHVCLINETVVFFWRTLDCLWEAAYYKEPPEVVKNKINVAEAILERILGIETGTLAISFVQG